MMISLILNILVAAATPKPLVQGMSWSIPVKVLVDSDTLGIVQADSASPRLEIRTRPSYPNATAERREILASTIKNIRHLRTQLIDSSSGIDSASRWWFQADYDVSLAGRPHHMVGKWIVHSGRTTQFLCVTDSVSWALQAPRVKALLRSILWEKTP